MTRGGRRPGAGQPPKYGMPMRVRVSLTMTEADHAEISAEVPDGEPFGRWVVEAALMRARAPELTPFDTVRCRHRRCLATVATLIMGDDWKQTEGGWLCPRHAP
jgi:hypothetical protein